MELITHEGNALGMAEQLSGGRGYWGLSLQVFGKQNTEREKIEGSGGNYSVALELSASYSM